MTGALLSALLLTAFALAPKARAADCVDDAKWKAVAGYYDSNKANSPNYGANWYRVLIAYRGEDPERALPTWAGATARPTAPFTADEAVDQEKVWSGWNPVRKALECLEKEPDPPPLPDAAAPSVLIDAIADGDEGTAAPLSATLSGGTYDGPPEHAWTVSKGALDDPTLASPTWTRPAVDSDGNVTVGLAVTVRGSGTNARSGTSATANAGASVLVRDSPPPPPPPSDPAPSPSSCVGDEQWDTVAGYYNSNRSKSPNYGANWYRVLIAYQGEDPERALPTWTGATAKPTTAYTVKEAEDGEKVWSGWTPVRKVLQCLEKAQQTTVEPEPEAPPQPQQGSQDQQVAATASVVFPRSTDTSFASEITENISWRNDNCVSIHVKLSQAVNQGYRYTITYLHDDSTADLTNELHTNGNNLTKGDISVFNIQAGNQISGSIGSGSTGPSSTTVCVRNDDIYEADETAVFQVVNAPDASNPAAIAISPSKYTVTIKNDDPKPSITLSAANVVEGEDVVVTVTADRPAQAAYDIKVAVTNETTDTDRKKDDIVTAKTHTVRMPALSKTATFKVPTIDDGKIHPSAALIGLSVEAVAADPYTAGTDITIQAADNGGRKIEMTVEMPDSVIEGNGGAKKEINFKLKMFNSPDKTVWIRVKGAGTARPAIFKNNEPVGVDDEPNPHWDYALARGNVKDGFRIGFPANKHSIFTQKITIHGDDTYEGDETIALDVSCESNCGGEKGDDYVIAVVNDPSPTVIKEDDPKPLLSLSAKPEVTEGDPIKVTVTADRPSQNPYSFDVIIRDDNSGLGETDRKAVDDATKRLDMAAYETEVSFTVPTIEHADIEDRGTRIFIKAHLPDFPYTTSNSRAVTPIVKDKLDAYNVSVSGLTTSVLEGDGEGNKVFPVSIRLDRALGQDFTLTARRTSSGTAKGVSLTCVGEFRVPPTADAVDWDYGFCGNINGHKITIPAGTTSKTLDIIVHEDDIYETAETFVFKVTCDVVSGNANGCGNSVYKVNVKRRGLVAITISNDDPKPELAVSEVPLYVVEGEDIEFKINANRPSQAAYDIHLDAGIGVPLSRRAVTVSPYETSKAFRESTTNDDDFKHDRFSLQFLEDSSYGYTLPNRGVSAGAAATVQVLDSIKPTVSLSAAQVEEGEDLVVKITADRALPLSYRFRVALERKTSEEPGNIFSNKQQTVTMNAWTTTKTLVFETRNNNRRDGNFNIDARIIKLKDNPYNDLWEKGPAQTFVITDSRDSNIPIVGFKTLTTPQRHVCANVEDTSLFDTGTENLHSFDCNLNVEAVPAGGVEFDLKMEITVPNKEESQQKHVRTVNVESNGVVPVTLNAGNLTDYRVDQGDSYVVTVKILPDPAYTVEGLDETYIELAEAHDFYGNKNSVYLNVRSYDESGSTTYDPFPVMRVNELLGKILEFQIATTFSHYRAETFRIQFNTFGGVVTDLIDERYLEEDNGSFYLKQSYLDPEAQTQVDSKVVLRPWESTVLFRLPLRSTRGDLDRAQDYEYDEETGRVTHLLRITPILECPASCYVNLNAADITYLVYPPAAPAEPLDPDDPNYVVNAHEYGARQCVEKNIPSGTRCGPGGNQFLVEYGHDPDAPHDEDDLWFYVYATPGLGEGKDQTVLMEWTGRNMRGENAINSGESTFTVPAEGKKVKLPFDTRNTPQWDDTLDVTFKAVDSIYQVLDEHKSHVIKVRNNDPMKWEWTENTLGNLDEGSFTKIAKIAMVKGHFMIIPDGVEWGLDFNVKGCALQSANPFPNGPSSAGDIPCYMALKPSTQKIEPDSFTGTGYVGNGWTFSASVGQDDDMDDEAITFDPEFSFLSVQVPRRGLGGNCDRDSQDYNEQCLGNFTAYDDDVANRRVTAQGQDMCVSFTLPSYKVVESNGPAQPVLRLHEYDAAEPDEGKRCKDGENGTTYTLADPDNVLLEAEAMVTFSHGTTSVADFQYDYASNNPIRVLFPSKAGTTAKFDVATVSNDGYEGNEHFDVSITSVANGLHIGNRSTARVDMSDTPSEITGAIETICDYPYWKRGVHYAKDEKVRQPGSRDIYARRQAGSDPFENDWPSNNSADWEKDDDLSSTCRQAITVEVLTKEVYESDISSGNVVLVRTRITTTRDWEMSGSQVLLFDVRNDKGRYVETDSDGISTTDRGRVSEAGILPHPFPSLKANVPMEVTYRVPTSSRHNSTSEDWPDGSFYLRDKKLPHYDYLTFKGGSLDYDCGCRPESKRVWLRDGIEDGDRKDLAFRAGSATSGSFKDNHADNLLYVGTSDRNLMDWETVEFPIEVRDGSLDAVPAGDYDLELVAGQGNVRLKELADGTYAFRLTGTFSGPGDVGVGGTAGANLTSDDRTFACGTEMLNPNRAGCLRYVNRRKGANGLEDAYEVRIGPAPTAGSGSYGETRNVTYRVPAGAAGRFTADVDPSGPPAGAARTVTMDPGGIDQVTEPASNGKTGMHASRVDVPFDLVVEPALPDGEHVVVELCTSGSTASYHADYRVMNWADGFHGATTGGEPYDQGAKCTKTKARLADDKTRFYLRVHGDGIDEGPEKVNMHVKVVDGRGNRVSWPGESADVAWTINDPAPPKPSSTSKRAKQPSPQAPPMEETIQVADGSRWTAALAGAAGGGAYWSFRQSWYEGGTHFRDGEGFDEAGIRDALHAMLEISLVTAHDPGLDVPYGEADRGVCLDPGEVPGRLEFEGFAPRALNWRDAPGIHLCRSFRDFENVGSWVGDGGLLVNEWGMYVRLGLINDDEANGDEATPAGFPFLLDNPAFPVHVEAGSLDMDTFIILDDDAGAPP